MTPATVHHRLRLRAAEQFAEAADLAHASGMLLAAHSNTSYALTLPRGTVVWFWTDRADGTLLDWVRYQVKVHK